MRQGHELNASAPTLQRHPSRDPPAGNPHPRGGRGIWAFLWGFGKRRSAYPRRTSGGATLAVPRDAIERQVQASFAAMDPALLRTLPSAPADDHRWAGRASASVIISSSNVENSMSGSIQRYLASEPGTVLISFR